VKPLVLPVVAPIGPGAPAEPVRSPRRDTAGPPAGAPASSGWRPLLSPGGPAVVVAPPPEVEAERERVHAEARADGLRAGRQAAAAEIEPLRAALRASVSALAGARAAVPRLAAEEVVELALLVAGHVLAQELPQHRELLLASVAEALARVELGPATVLRIHPEELALVAAQQGAAPGLQLLADATLAPGELVVETSDQVVDGRVAARLVAMRAALVAALQADPGEAGGA
jgi:flagellar assembly protein FliH